MDETNISKTVQDSQANASMQSPASLAYMKARQCAKIAELHTALVNAGLVSLELKGQRARFEPQYHMGCTEG